MGKPCKKILYTIIITCKCKQTNLNALSVTVVITFKAIRNELCTECSFSAIELNVWVWRSVMREQASAAERRASAVSLSIVPSTQRSSYYVLSRMKSSQVKSSHVKSSLIINFAAKMAE